MDVWIDDVSTLLVLPQDVMLSGVSISAVRRVMDESLFSDPGLLYATRDMSGNRRAEFMAGRICAARSLRKMGVVAAFPLPGRNRQPVWPTGVLGSISHCSTTAVAVATAQSRYCALGVDVEPLIGPAIAQQIQRSICRDEELIGLERSVPGRKLALTLLFSAKEALFKALFPQVGGFKDFYAAEFFACEARSLVLRLTQDWNSQWLAGKKVKVRYAWRGEEVFSAVYLSRTGN